MMRALLAASLCAGWVMHGADFANAQTYPSKEPIKVVVPFPPGGPTDGMARIISERLGTVLGQSIVIENHGGAGGSVGGKFVAAADPDGYTTSDDSWRSADDRSGRKPRHRLRSRQGVCVGLPAHRDAADHLGSPGPARKINGRGRGLCQGQSGQDPLGLPGLRHRTHLLAEMFKLEAGVNILHVPYRGTGPMLNAILANEVQIIADPSTTSLPYIEDGKLRPIAIAGNVRHPKLPNVPTVVEAGFPKLQAPFWLAVVAPAGTPPDIIGKLNNAFHQACSPPLRLARGRRARRRDQDRHPAGSRQDARLGARAVDRSGQGGKYQDGMTLYKCGLRGRVEPSLHQHRNAMTIFRRDTPAEAEFRMAVRTWRRKTNLPVALRGRTARPAPAELMPWYW